MAKKQTLTTKQKEVMAELSNYNNKLRWFFINNNFKIFDRTLKVGWYEMTGTRLTVNDVWVHDIKLKDTKENIRITDIEYKKMISENEKFNKHLR